MVPPADAQAALRRLPKVDEALASPAIAALAERAPRWAVVAAVREEIARLRGRILDGAHIAPPGDDKLPIDAGAVAARVTARLRPSLVRVINATGVVLHTNLGRAPLAREALDRVVETARGYANLEYALDARRRGSRHDHVRALLREVTGAEDGLVVNNCAAAVLLALAAHAGGRAAVVSRGELVEIGGSFRMPDVMRAAGVRLVEVGTTNRTHARDYEAALEPAASDVTVAAVLKVHRSNFVQEGFVAEVSVADLAAIAHARGLPLVVDVGAGALTADRGGAWAVRELVAAGADLVLFSGDKLLGGPQAGVLVGRAAAIAPLRSHPLLRALRPSRLVIAALEATLALHRDGRAAEIPSIEMLSASAEVLRARAESLLAAVRARVAPSLAAALEVRETRSAVGGGALPGDEPPSFAVTVGPPAHPESVEAALRRSEPPIIGRLEEGRLLLDVRTLFDSELAETASALAAALSVDHDHARRQEIDTW
jgi:L-seryl-tRNA(Ser) seleniumtransferase